MPIVGYDVVVTKPDKDRSRYDARKNIVYTRQLPMGYKYFLEAQNYNPTLKDYDRYFIFSRDYIEQQCRNVDFDDFGRYKIRPVAHKEYLSTYFKNDVFDLVLYEHQSNYDVYLLP